MTVIDLTIMETLAHRGEIKESELKENPIVIWREDIDSDFNYEPFLVDNEFANRVDIVKTSLNM